MRRIGLAALALLMLPMTDVLADGAPPAAGREVTVIRGPGSGPLPAPPPAASAEPRTAAGRTLWRIDETRSTVVGCRLEGTMMVGQRRVRCARSRLPEP